MCIRDRGVMGYPMAGHLQKNGYNVTVFNRTESKAKKWVEEYGGQMGKTPNEASLNAEIVFMCVGRDEDIVEVMEGNNGILFSAKGGLIIVDQTTASAEIARTYFTKLQEMNISFLDAPVSGGQGGAENGILSIMIGGEEKDFEVVKPVLETYGKAIELIITAQMITAQDANVLGIANYVVPASELLKNTLKLALRVVGNSGSAIASAIKAVNAGINDNGYATEIEEFGKLFGTPDFKEGTTAFLEKRKPKF